MPFAQAHQGFPPSFDIGEKSRIDGRPGARRAPIAHHTWAEAEPQLSDASDQALFTARIDVLDAPSFKRQVLNIAKTGPSASLSSPR